MNTYIAIFLIFIQVVWWIWVFLPKRVQLSNENKSILFASESGQAQKIAKETQKQLGPDWQIQSMADFTKQSDISTLARRTTIFVVSTTGDGDAPENGRAFFKQLGAKEEKLENAQYAVLALGDSEYPKYCQFGVDLDIELQRVGATPLFDLITVDNLNEKSLGNWSEKLSDAFSVEQIEMESNLSKAFSASLSKRHCVNPDSPSDRLYEINLTVPNDCVWQGGDIVQITVPQGNSDAVMREYSIANANHATGELQLLIRQVVIDEGEKKLGKGSGYLTEHADSDENIQIRIRENSSFKLPEAPTPMIFIATGSGLAGVASIIDEADKCWSKPFNEHQGGHWLIYGERHPEHENPYNAKLSDWQNRNVLAKVTKCFSRTDESYPKYVQDAITTFSDEVKKWIIERNAIVYVCGSKERLGETIPALISGIVNKDIKSQIKLDVY